MTVVSMVRAMLKAKDLPRELWGEAISIVVYILNRSSSKTLQGQTPHEKWTGIKPSVDHMRTFGSIFHVKNTKGHLSKLEDRSQPMLFIGYERGTKAYKCFDPVNFKVIISEMLSLKKKRSGLGQRKVKIHIHSPSYLTSSLIKHKKMERISQMKKWRSLLPIPS